MTDAPADADFIYILGGDYQVRGNLTAQLIREGKAPRVVLAREADDPTLRQNQSDLLERQLLTDGVPRKLITQLTTVGGVKSTADEARVLVSYLGQSHANSVMVVTSSFHGRRARLVIRRALRGTGVRAVVVTADSHFASRTHWQETEIGRQTIELECVKLIYYALFFWG